MSVEEQMHLQLVNALLPYKGRNDIEAVYGEFHSPVDTPAIEVAFASLMACVSPATVAKLLMWPSFVDFKNMVLAQDVQGLMLYVQALTYAGVMPQDEAQSVIVYLGTVRPATFVQAPIVEAFDFFKLRERYGADAVGMPNIIPMEDFTLAMMEVNNGS